MVTGQTYVSMTKRSSLTNVSCHALHMNKVVHEQFWWYCDGIIISETKGTQTDSLLNWRDDCERYGGGT